MKSNIEHWNVEDAIFWKETGNKIAKRNLWISIPAAESTWVLCNLRASVLNKSTKSV